MRRLFAERLDRHHGRRRPSSTNRAGCSSKTVVSCRSATASRRRRTRSSISAARSSRPDSSTRITISSRRSRGRGRRRPTSSPGCASSTRLGDDSTTRPSTRRRGQGSAELALSGCTTVFDHHYVFPRGTSGLVEAEVQAARELGVRIVASRGSMDLGESHGRTAAGLCRRVRRRRYSPQPRRWRARSTTRTRGDGADRRGAMLAVLRHEAADGGLRGAGAAPRPPAPHASRRDRGGGRVLP